MSVFLFHNSVAMSKHMPPLGGPPERAIRLTGIERALEKTGIGARCVERVVDTPFPREKFVAEYGESVIAGWEAGVRKAVRFPVFDDKCGDIYWSEGSLEAVGIAAQAAVSAVETVLTNPGSHAFAIVRPPGHHCFDLPAGFCIANNVVLAAHAARSAGKRVAIIDWDYHFGDGTARATFNDPDILFCSLHCERDKTRGFTYPMDPLKGDDLLEATGGRCFNIMWDYDDADDAAYAYAFDRVVLPAIGRFAPDIILVSAGYDALRGDKLAGMRLSPSIFRELTLGLKTLGVPIVCVLEGGYSPDLLGAGVCETLKGLLDDSEESLCIIADTVLDSHRKTVDRVAALLEDEEASGDKEDSE
jgi:acetoin utilization deacetylase AcuC-like enzyme